MLPSSKINNSEADDNHGYNNKMNRSSSGRRSSRRRRNSSTYTTDSDNDDCDNNNGILTCGGPGSQAKVRFASVEILYFPLTLGDNPAVSEGAPLTIGWKPFRRSSTSIQQWESERRGTRKGKHKLQIPAVEREVHLLAHGFRMADILRASEATDKAREERLKSIRSRKWDRFTKVWDTALGRLKMKKRTSSTSTATATISATTSSVSSNKLGRDAARQGLPEKPGLLLVSANSA